MFSKALTAFTIVTALALQANAHAGITPALGVTGTFARGNVQRPSAANECGNINVAQNIDKSTPVAASANGQFTVTVTNFNAGQDGSRQVSATVDATGTGKTFAGQVSISKNGNGNPTSTGSDQVTAALPAGTKCTGGASGNLCLVSFKTTAGFGNCVVVQQGAAQANAGAANANGTANAGGVASNAGTAVAGTAAKGATANNGATAQAGAAQKATGGRRKKQRRPAAAKAKANANANATVAQPKKPRNIGGTRMARVVQIEME